MDESNKKLLNEKISKLGELDICTEGQQVVREMFEIALGVSLEPEKPKKEGFTYHIHGSCERWKDSRTILRLYHSNIAEGDFENTDLVICDKSGDILRNGKILRVNADGTVSYFTGIGLGYGIVTNKIEAVQVGSHTLTQDE